MFPMSVQYGNYALCRRYLQVWLEHDQLIWMDIIYSLWIGYFAVGVGSCRRLVERMLNATETIERQVEVAKCNKENFIMADHFQCTHGRQRPSEDQVPREDMEKVNINPVCMPDSHWIQSR